MHQVVHLLNTKIQTISRFSRTETFIPLGLQIHIPMKI